MKTFALSGSVVATIIVLASGPAHAQTTRTWVSGTGDDSNPCSRTLPCKTFAGAIARTASNGIISCVDRTNFGIVTITKSVTLDCPGGMIVQPAAASPAVTVFTAGITVVLRGLSIEGARTGTVGVRLVAGSKLHMEDCRVSGFVNALNVLPPAGATTDVVVRNSSFSDNSGASVNVFASGSGIANVIFSNVRVDNNRAGLLASSGSPGSVRMTFRNSSFSANQNEGVIIDGNGGGAVYGMFSGTVISNNGTTGLYATGPLAFVHVTASKISGNVTGWLFDGGATLGTYQNNQLTLNLMTDGTASTPLTPQ